jgi:hypothetical protein
MFNGSGFFGSNQEERSGSSRVVGGIGLWLLHIVMFTFAIYSGAHGVNASLQYAGSSDLARIAQIIGIVSIELVLIGIYLSFLNGKITGAAQSIAAGATFLLGFVLALMGIVADSQVNSGAPLSPVIEFYLRWGLPIAPGVMSFGALLIHALSPDTMQFRKRDQQKRDLEDLSFAATLEIERARFQEEISKRGLQLLSRKAVLQELESIYQSAEFRDAIKRTAVDRAPELFSEAGILIDRVTIPGDPPRTNRAPVEPVREPAPSSNGHNGNGSFLR